MVCLSLLFIIKKKIWLIYGIGHVLKFTTCILKNHYLQSNKCVDELVAKEERNIKR